MLRRLEQAVLADGTVQNYSFDGNGNRNQMSVTKNNVTAVTDYAYDLNDRLISETVDNISTRYTYDGNGNMLGKSDGTKTVTQEFDLLNRMTSYSDGTVTATYTYYPDNMRRSKTVDNSTTTHIWLGSEIALDITGGNVVSYIGGVKSDYGRYLYNAHGDVVQIADEFGAVVRSYDYDPYGNQLTEIDGSDRNPYRYSGEYYDIESGYVYLRARYYDSSTGRFISEDPAFDGYNWYAYCGGNPVNRWDPSGNSWIDNLIDNWKVGLGVLREKGTTGNIAASLCEGIVTGVGETGYAMVHPIESFEHFCEDPLRNNPIYGAYSFADNLVYDISCKNWDNVAYDVGKGFGSATIIVASSWALNGIASNIAPKGFQASLQGSFRYGNGAATISYAFSISVTGEALATGVATVDAGYIMCARGGFGDFGGREKIGKSKGNMPGNNQVQNQQVRDALNQIGKFTEKTKGFCMMRYLGRVMDIKKFLK